MRLRIAVLASLAAFVAACGAIEKMTLSPERPSLAWRHEEDVTPRDAAVTRFFAIGDTGEREETDSREPRRSTKLAACEVRAVCKDLGGCDFGLFLGDNVYPTGVDEGAEGRDDIEFLRRFTTDLYGGTGALYFVLGNHDWGPHAVYGAPPSTQRARRELAAIEELSWPWKEGVSPVRGRAHFYDFAAGHARVFAWDTNYLVHKCQSDGQCREGIDEGIAAISREVGKGDAFSIVVGHHPYLSNGKHGDAGEFMDGLVSVGNGKGLRRLLDQHVIGKAALYMSGHDHNLQAFRQAGADGAARATAVVVSGAGTKTDPRGKDRPKPADFECYDGRLGFAIVEARRDRLTVKLYAFRQDTTCASLAPAFVMSRGKRDGAWKTEAGGDSCPP